MNKFKKIMPRTLYVVHMKMIFQKLIKKIPKEKFSCPCKKVTFQLLQIHFKVAVICFKLEVPWSYFDVNLALKLQSICSKFALLQNWSNSRVTLDQL